MSDFKKVQVKWVDSVRSDGWQYVEDIKADCIDCETIGYLVAETDRCYCLTSTLGLNPLQLCQYISIPKCAVKEFKELAI